MSFVKKYFTCSDAVRNNCSKKSIQHLSAFSTAVVATYNGSVELRYTPRPLKEILFIRVSPTVFELKNELEERDYLTNYYKFVCSNKFSLCDILDEYMTENYSSEYWQIIEKHPYLNLCCSCTISVRDIGKKKVFVNSYFYDYSCVGLKGIWYKNVWREYENEDFDKMICCGLDRRSLNDMLLRQLSNFCRRSRHIFSHHRYLLAYDVFFAVFKSIVLDRCFSVCLCI